MTKRDETEVAVTKYKDGVEHRLEVLLGFMAPTELKDGVELALRSIRKYPSFELPLVAFTVQDEILMMLYGELHLEKTKKRDASNFVEVLPELLQSSIVDGVLEVQFAGGASFKRKLTEAEAEKFGVSFTRREVVE